MQNSVLWLLHITDVFGTLPSESKLSKGTQWESQDGERPWPAHSLYPREKCVWFKISPSSTFQSFREATSKIEEATHIHSAI